MTWADVVAHEIVERWLAWQEPEGGLLRLRPISERTTIGILNVDLVRLKADIAQALLAHGHPPLKEGTFIEVRDR